MNKRELLDALNKDFNHSIRDPLWNDIKLDTSIKKIVLTKAVQKLSRIKQNGPTSLIYPGAVHTRLNHSLGVYHIGRKIILSLINKQDCPFTTLGVRSFLVACLLHDIGHFPYAHSLKELSLKEHEELAREIILKDSELSNAIKQANASVDYVCQIIDENINANSECMIYRNILSGALDPDKLDYLNRDAFFAGVPYGTQNNEYIISSLSLVNNKIVLDREASSSLENILFSKYLMYKNVYWHKGVRSATAMIKKAILSAINDKVLNGEDLYFIDDYEFYQLKNENFEAFELIKYVNDNVLFSKKYEKEYEDDGILENKAKDIYSRFKVEDEIYNLLKNHYSEIKKHEVIIDIQEPISFEADLMLKNSDESLSNFNQVSNLFSTKIGKQFSKGLRSVSIYCPDFVCPQVLKEIVENGK